MAKRSTGQFARRENDAYWTPAKAAAPLLPHLARGTRFIEPCCGALELVRFLEGAGHIGAVAADIAPPADVRDVVDIADARTADYRALFPDVLADCFITNPPWSRDLLHPIIANLSRQLPAWLLFQSDWRHTEQAAPFLPFLRTEIGIGRVKWIPDSAHDGGYENASWYLFDATDGAQDRYPPGCLFFTRWAASPAGYPPADAGGAPPGYPQTMMEA